MTTKTNSGTVSVSRELLVDLLDAAKWKAADFAKGTPYRTTIDGIVRQTKDLLAQPADQQGEPVAWQWRRKTVQEGSQWTAWTDCAKGDYEACIASPQPSVRGIIREARRLYAAQPATAKVDEQAEALKKAKANTDYDGFDNGVD